MKEGNDEHALNESMKYYRLVLREIRERRERVELIRVEVDVLKRASSEEARRIGPPLASVSELEHRSKRLMSQREEIERQVAKLRNAEEDLARAIERKIEVIAELQSQGVSTAELASQEQENEF